jgi:hypothetical protein
VAQLSTLGGKTRMKTSTLIFSVANLIGLLLCALFVGGMVHLAKMEQQDYYDASDSFTFIGTAGPVLLVCFTLNAIWGIKALVDFFAAKIIRRYWH